MGICAYDLDFSVKQHKIAILRRNTPKNLPFSQNYTPDFCLLLPIEHGPLGLQRRDILKEYGSGRFLVAALGIENQSTIDSDMPVRVMGYDYAACRDQINKSKKRVPVITIILNFSRTEWKTPLSLKDMFHLSEDLDPFVQD